jgi:hypothetical protein
MLKFFMLDGKWGASDVAEGVDYLRTAARLRTRNMTFRLTIFTVVVRARCYLYPDYAVQPWFESPPVTRLQAPIGSGNPNRLEACCLLEAFCCQFLVHLLGLIQE